LQRLTQRLRSKTRTSRPASAVSRPLGTPTTIL
jgi:hypothetical protein